MSFIRSTSCPERLYIWDDIDGYIHATWMGLMPALTSRRCHMRLPRQTFYGAVARWHTRGSVRYRGFVIREQHVYMKTGRKVSERQSLRRMLSDKKRSEFLVRISYRGRFVYLFRVTWAYVVNNVRSRKNLAKVSS